MTLTVKHFNELTVLELFEIFRLRVSVFVVEQSCPYQEIDEFDKEAFHVYLSDENGIAAYARVLPAGTVFDTPSIGRVIAVIRRQGLGTRIVEEAIKVVQERFNTSEITIEAQCYAKGLYEKVGFIQQSEEFLEDGIPHIRMNYFDLPQLLT